MAEAPQRPRRARRRRQRSAVERVRDVSFPIVLRGYDRERVDRYVADMAQLVAELEASQLPESVVQKALDEVGEQTSSILQRARETADEIEARSWSQAEGRLQRAETEADEARREADLYAEQVAADTRAIWEQRQRLIEEIRQLADEVLGVADDALERLQEPDTSLADDEAEEEADAEPAADDNGYQDTAFMPRDELFGTDDTTAESEFVPEDTTVAEAQAEETLEQPGSAGEEEEPAEEGSTEFPQQAAQRPQD